MARTASCQIRHGLELKRSTRDIDNRSQSLRNVDLTVRLVIGFQLLTLFGWRVDFSVTAVVLKPKRQARLFVALITYLNLLMVRAYDSRQNGTFCNKKVYRHCLKIDPGRWAEVEMLRDDNISYSKLFAPSIQSHLQVTPNRRSSDIIECCRQPAQNRLL